MINRIVVAYEAGRDGFSLARWLQAQAVEAPVSICRRGSVARTPSRQDGPSRYGAADMRRVRDHVITSARDRLLQA